MYDRPTGGHLIIILMRRYIITCIEIYHDRKHLQLLVLLVDPRVVADAVAPVAVFVPLAVIVDEALEIVVIAVVSIL